MKILLQEIMFERNISVRQVSILTGVPKSTVNKIANGQISPRLDTVEQLAVGLKLRITDLFDSPFK